MQRGDQRRGADFLRGWIGTLATGESGGGPRLASCGFWRGRYDSPSMTKSKALFLNRSTALWASSASSNAAIHSDVSRFDVTIVLKRPFLSTKSW